MTQPTSYDPPCTWPTAGDDAVGASCTACGHTNLVHPGRSSDTLRACAICELLVLRDELRDRRDPDVTDPLEHADRARLTSLRRWAAGPDNWYPGHTASDDIRFLLRLLDRYDRGAP